MWTRRRVVGATAAPTAAATPTMPLTTTEGLGTAEAHVAFDAAREKAGLDVGTRVEASMVVSSGS